MPVIATPAQPVEHNCGSCEPESGSGGSTPAPVPCDGVGILSTEPTNLNGNALRTRLRSVSLQQGQCATIDWTLHDRSGKPVDLSGCGFGTDEGSSSAEEVSLGSEESIAASTSKLVFRMREYIATNGGGGSFIQIDDVTVINAAEGKVRIQLLAEHVQLAGVYFGELALIETDGEGSECIVLSNVFYVVINKGLYGSDRYRGAPSIAEIRLHLRDSHPDESYLLDGLAFDDAEIAFCVARPIEYWNEVPPPIKKFTTQTFPYRYHWLDAIIGNLFLMAEESHRRNQLQYSAGGINIDDMNKERNYGAAAAKRLAEWKEWVRQKKIEINLQDAFGGIGSPYGG